MIITLRKMEQIMPLELWGIAVGLLIGMILWALFLMFIEWMSSKN